MSAKRAGGESADPIGKKAKKEEKAGSSEAKASFDFTGKLALISGSTSGIGYAIARQFYESGARVVIHGRSQETIQTTIKRIQEESKGERKGELYAAPGDLSKKEGANAVINATEAIGDLDFLINNVGIFEVVQYEAASDEVWDKHWQTNVMSAVRLSRHFLPGMLKRNRGRIIMVSSETGLRPLTQFCHYSVSKTAMISLARGYAELCKGSNVTVNSLLAGPTWTGGVVEYIQNFAKAKGYREGEEDKAKTQYFKEHEPTSLLQRFLTADEVATPCVYLCTDAAVGTNGHAQRAEGGIVRCL